MASDCKAKRSDLSPEQIIKNEKLLQKEIVKEELIVIENFCKHYCVVCKKMIRVFCGTPVVHIGGCCVGVHSKVSNTRYIRTMRSHMGCYLSTKENTQKRLKMPKLKLNWEFEDIKKIIDKNGE